MTADRNFAKDVARLIEKRRRRRKLIWWCAIAALVVIAIVYLRCGRGWGTGGSGEGGGSGTAAQPSPADTKPVRCAIRVAADGITVAGKPATRDRAVAACRALGAADVVVTGDAREGDWSALRAALDAAHVNVFVREP
jgi:hypothetical protein